MPRDLAHDLDIHSGREHVAQCAVAEDV